jgi:toluene monooxygenase system protein A
MAVYAVRDAVGRLENVQSLSTPWINGLKVHAAALPLAEFAGVIGNLRGTRFGRDSAWRAMACFGASTSSGTPGFPCF